MPPSTPLKSKPDEKDVSLIDYNGAVNQLITISKQELESVRHQIVLQNVNLTRLREDLLKKTNEFEKWKRSEEQKFKDDLAQRRQDIIKNQQEINNHVIQQRQITADLQFQQQKFEGINKDRLALKEQLVKLEGLKIQAEEDRKAIEIQRANVLNSQNEANALHLKVKEMEDRNKQENIRLTNLNEALESRAREISEKEKNLSSLKEFVEPKIKTIQEQQDALDVAKKENEERIAQLLAKIEEEKILFKSITDKKLEVERQEKELILKKEEFNRIQALSQGAK